jgi:DNA-binding transcriptional LysR family regulator
MARRDMERMAERLTLRQLHAFVALAEAGGFTQAAARLHMSQSNLSVAIRLLEETIGTRLFDRHTRNVVMTPTAADLLPHVKRILTELAQLVEGMADQGQTATVRIATIPALAGDLLPRLLGLLDTNARVEILDGTRPDVLGAVRSGLADFGILIGHATPSDLQAHPFLKQDMMLVCLSDHPLATKSAVALSDLAKYPLIGPVRDQVIYTMLANRFRHEGLQLDLRYEVTFISTILGLVAQGLGIGFVYECLRPLVERMGLIHRPFTERLIPHELAIVVPRSRPLAYAATQMRSAILRLPAEAILGDGPRSSDSE